MHIEITVYQTIVNYINLILCPPINNTENLFFTIFFNTLAILRRQLFLLIDKSHNRKKNFT